MIRAVLQGFNPRGPLFLGLAFIAPLTTTLLTRTGPGTSFGFSPVWTGLAFGAAWGLYAKFRGKLAMTTTIDAGVPAASDDDNDRNELIRRERAIARKYIGKFPLAMTIWGLAISFAG
jgi:hypothetical protein